MKIKNFSILSVHKLAKFYKWTWKFDLAISRLVHKSLKISREGDYSQGCMEIWKYYLWSFKSGGVKKVSKMLGFLCQKLSDSFFIFFFIEFNITFLFYFFFDSINFWNFPLHWFSNFNNVLSVCYFLGKNLSNFIYQNLKLLIRYCHNGNGSKRSALHNGFVYLPR